MYIDGTVLFIEEHPTANKIVKTMRAIWNEDDLSEEALGRIYMKFGDTDMAMIDKGCVERNANVFIHIEGNIFTCIKSRKFIPGDQIYFLNSELEEFKNV